jgi:hypothetical protein
MARLGGGSIEGDIYPLIYSPVYENQIAGKFFFPRVSDINRFLITGIKNVTVVKPVDNHRVLVTDAAEWFYFIKKNRLLPTEYLISAPAFIIIVDLF